MKFSNLFPQSSTLEEDYFIDESILDCKPFQNKDFENSSEDLGNSIEENENPFAENFGIFKKLKPSLAKCNSLMNYHSAFLDTTNYSDSSLEYQHPLKRSLPSKLPKINYQNWSRRSFAHKKTNSLIQSAPISFGSSVHDTENNGERITLPTLGCGRSDSIKRISGITLINLLKEQDKENYVIIDARFRYEYEGGHIRNSINLNNEIDIQKRVEENKIIILYCELSSVRGPGLAKKLRNRDRIENKYPNLKYPEIYVLEGGYRKFYQNFPEYCAPKNYVQMHDKRYKTECVNNHKILKLNKS